MGHMFLRWLRVAAAHKEAASRAVVVHLLPMWSQVPVALEGASKATPFCAVEGSG